MDSPAATTAAAPAGKPSMIHNVLQMIKKHPLMIIIILAIIGLVLYVYMKRKLEAKEAEGVKKAALVAALVAPLKEKVPPMDEVSSDLDAGEEMEPSMREKSA